MKLILLALPIAFILACSSSKHPPLDVVRHVDLQRYLGKWYEIARLPTSFEKGCFCSMAEYSLLDDGRIKVLNSCRKDSPTGEVKTADGKAEIIDTTTNAKLKVWFFWPFKGDYWIIDLDEENYTYAVVGAPNREYLWILSRTPKIDESLYNELVSRAKSKGFNTDMLERTDQSCSNL